MADVAVLEIVVYEAIEAARLLGLHVKTLRNWLEGYATKVKSYPPVLRQSAIGSDLVTWGEFVEAGFLTEYRKVHKIPLSQLREYVGYWRAKLGVPHPLAHRQPYVGPGPSLIDKTKEATGEWILYRFQGGQMMLTPWAERFVEKVEFDCDVAQRYRPAGKHAPVVIDPRRSFGAPTVSAIRTEVLYEMFQAGDPVSALAETYELSVHDVEAAIRYESLRSKPIAIAA